MFQAKQFPLALFTPLAVALTACSPQSYQVNQNPNTHKASGSIPESKQDGYMRIIGNIRWDRYSSPEAWQARFPGCFSDLSKENNRFSSLYPIGMSRKTAPIDYLNSLNQKCSFVVGGLHFSVFTVHFEKDPSTARPLRLASLSLHMPREDEERAFYSAIKEKYPISTGSGNCSKYTCFFRSSQVSISPTPYTTSILDAVMVDSSQF